MLKSTFGKLALLVALCLTWNIANANQISSSSKASTLVSYINRRVLIKMFRLNNPSEVDVRGLHFIQPKLPGLSQNFYIGVQQSPDRAFEVWQNWTQPDNTIEQSVQNIGDHVKAWKWKEKSYYLVVFTRNNVTVGFEWNGAWQDAIKFGGQLDEALQHNRELAPQAGQVAVPNVEIVAPALCAVGEPFKIMYRVKNDSDALATKQPILIGMAKEARIEMQGKAGSVTANLSGTPLMSDYGATDLTLTSEGVSNIEITFVSYGAVVFHHTIHVAFKPSTIMNQMKGATEWNLPEKAIYFTSVDTLPSSKSQRIVLENSSVRSAQDNKEKDILNFKQLEAWNQMAQVMNIKWLPDIQQIKVFRNMVEGQPVYSAYATYEKDSYRFLWMSNIGQQSWLYVEALPGQKVLSPQDVLVNGVDQVLSNTFRVYRLLSHEAKAEHVDILLLQISQGADINLHFPGYP